MKHNPCLPAIGDPDGLITEDDPAVLDSYAQQLLTHLDNIKAGGPKKGYGVAKVRAAAAWLLDRYAHAGLQPCHDAYLLQSIAKHDPKVSTFRKVQESNDASYWLALRFEAATLPDPAGRQPSVAKLDGIVRHLRREGGLPNLGKRSGRSINEPADPEVLRQSAKSTVKGWRKLPHYRMNVEFLRDPIAALRSRLLK